MNANPLHSLFALLSACRHGYSASTWKLNRALRRRASPLWPRPSFWIRLSRAACLLDDSPAPQPTLLVPEWLTYPLGVQLSDLLRAWHQIPSQASHQRVRARLLDRLHADAIGKPARLEPVYQRELVGLQALGLYAKGQLTPMGQALLTRQLDQITPTPPTPWTISGLILIVPAPADWSLLWELEAFLEPISPGRYLLTQAAGQKAVGEKLVRTLEHGLAAPLPEEIREQLSEPPAVRLLNGPVLEFDDPALLARLRESPRLRRDLDQLLSPRHVHLEANRAAQIMRRLQHLTYIPHTSWNGNGLAQLAVGAPAGFSSGFSSGERAYLLSLVLAAEKINLPLSAPLGLTAKLESGLPGHLQKAAARALAHLAESPLTGHSLIEDELPPPPTPQLLETLQRAVTNAEAVEVLYHAPGRPAPEPRRLTPLLVEQRGLRHYLIAYCHTRRANRTFRIDRLLMADGRL